MSQGHGLHWHGLRCGECGREIRGLTGLDELQNLRAHMAEHHDVSLSLPEAAELRIELERAQAK